MPFPLPSRTPSGPRRRSLLASAAGAALLAGCSPGADGGGEGGADASGSPAAAERARARAAADSGGLVARYDAVLAVHPGLAGLLGPLRAEVVRHVDAFGGVRGTPPSRSASPTGSPAGPPSGSASAPPPASGPSPAPVLEKDALAQLAAAERALADRRAAELVGLPGEPARLLASVAAAGAAHAYLLTEGTR
ncbi:hypothetical protein GCM10010269_76090 [Streptomyces humidus]|uniref:Lipoprotein n=1 Tax=Streptomyces humidus TaxID=52259 RepID=A0A918GAK3_9ACTN|nr:hypothetical protein [Streptomyces humidus]GGS26231.1 hypothetical protein GCM10010269_76090 [Streptomyces humidus]